MPQVLPTAGADEESVEQHVHRYAVPGNLLTLVKILKQRNAKLPSMQ